MKKLIFLISFVLSFQAFAGISIISDLDDTIKITQASGNPTDYVDDDVYTGMPELLMGAKDYTNELYIVTASPSFMRPKIRSGLRKRKISYKELITRANLTENKLSYKVKAFRRIMDASTDDFIFLGDDVGQDPEVFTEIKRLYPGRVVASYVHVVTNRPALSGMVSYWTSFDVALRELVDGRMSPGWVELISEKLMLEPKFRYIFPRKANCPTTETPWEWQYQTAYQPEAFRLVERITSLCLARQSGKFLSH